MDFVLFNVTQIFTLLFQSNIFVVRFWQNDLQFAVILVPLAPGSLVFLKA